MRKQKGGILIWQEDKAERQRIEIMLRKGKKAEDIAEFCDYPLSLVKEVEKSMLVVS